MLKPIANSGQNSANTFKVYESDNGCCNDVPSACQYDVVIPTANAVNNIIFKRSSDSGATAVTKTFSPAVTGGANVVAAIKAALAAEGYENDDQTPIGVSSYVDGTNTVYQITGNIVVVSMLHNTSTTVTATQKCTETGRCTYTNAYAGGNGDAFVVNGTSTNLGDLTYASTTAAQVDSALAALVPAGTAVTVTKANNVFTIVIYANQGTTLTLDGVDFTVTDCGPGFVA